MPQSRLQTLCETRAPDDWDQYVDGHSQASAYHRAAAVAIGQHAFNLNTYFICARDAAGQLTGVLPLVEQSSLLFGRFLVSLPFFTYGGILANSEESAGALARAASELARQRAALHLELRHTAPFPSQDLRERLDKVSMVLPLPATPEALGKQLGSKLRSQIKRASREELVIEWGGRELLDDFYAVFAPSMHDLGTPVYPRRFFRVVADAMQDRCAVLVIRVGGKPEAAAFVVQHPRSIEVPWAAASGVAKKAAINMRMYWEMLCYAIRQRAESFDFGRSTVDSGTYRFKAQWGAQPLQLHWHYWLSGARPIPKLNQSNPKYALAAQVWRRMPLWCANFVGPYIVRNLP